MTPAQRASAFLLDLAHGKYDAEVNEVNAILRGSGQPMLMAAGSILNALVELNKQTAPASVQEDGQGGIVPTTNSRIDPKTGEFA